MPIWIPLAVAAAVQTTANIIGNVHRAKVAKRNTDKTIAENKAQAELAYQREQKNISELLKYNEPSSQMARFEAAGLNRNLIYTQGNPGNQSVYAKYSPPNFQYQYEPSFEGSSLEPITSLPMAAQQFKKLVAENRIKEAEATIQEAISKYADKVAKWNAEITFNRSEAELIKRVFSDQEFKIFFKLDPVKDTWSLIEGMEETFINNVAYKWLMPQGQYENYQSTVAYRDKQLEMLSGVLPWMRPFIEFLRLLK